MNIDCETVIRFSTAAFLMAVAVSYMPVMRWMRKAGKTYSHEVWLCRCCLIYAMLAVCATGGFNFTAKALAFGIVFHLAVDNPWMIRRIERTRAEQGKAGPK